MPASIIRGSCRFDSKIRVFLKGIDFVSSYKERSKNFFRKIEICQKLPSFFADFFAKNRVLESIFITTETPYLIEPKMKIQAYSERQGIFTEDIYR